MKESFVTPLLLALFFVGVTLGISSMPTSPSAQLAQVGTTDVNTLVTGSLPVTFASTVSGDINCTTSGLRRMVGFFTQPTAGGYFSVYGAGGTDMGDREPGLYDFPPGTYTWEGHTRTGYMRAGTYTGSFTISGTCPSTTTPPPPTAATTNTVSPTTTNASVPPPAPVTPIPATPRVASVMVSVGTACTLEKGMTQVAVSIEPRETATVLFKKENGNAITSASQGIIYLPNGTYTWKAEPKSEYTIPGISSGTFTLVSCPTHLAPSVVVGSACDPVEEGVPATFKLEGEGRAYFSLTNIMTKETVPLEVGTEYLPNGSYAWSVVGSSNASPLIFNGETSGNFTISACKAKSTTPYVPPKAGTLLFFRDGKLIDPIVRGGEKIAVRVDLSGVSAVELERVGKDTREVLGTMTKDDGTTRWLFAWSVGNLIPGEYNLIARAKGAKSESVSGSRIVTVLPSNASATLVAPEPAPLVPRPVTEEFPPLGEVTAPDQPLFSRLKEEENLHDALLSLPVRGVADLISTEDILSAKRTLPDAIKSPEDLRVFCSTETNDDVCFEFIPEVLREEARATVEEARKEIARAFKERPVRIIDTDKDGITDFDETHFYGTDPEKGDSDGDGRKDQEELLSDNNPLEKTANATPVVFEHPIFGGEERPELLVVNDVRVGTGTISRKEALPVILSGKALPGAIVTLYVYSDPIIIRVKAGEDGLWSYTLTKELPDGSHKAYVAMTDSAGRVLAKSAPLPFVKEAAAVSVISGGLPGTEPSAPSLFTGASLYAVIFIIFGVLGFAVLAIGVVVRSRKDESVIP